MSYTIESIRYVTLLGDSTLIRKGNIIFGFINFRILTRGALIDIKEKRPEDENFSVAFLNMNHS